MSEGGVGVEGREAPTHGQPRRAAWKEEGWLPFSVVASTDASSRSSPPAVPLSPASLPPYHSFPCPFPNTSLLQLTSNTYSLSTSSVPCPNPSYIPVPCLSNSRTVPPNLFSDHPYPQLSPFTYSL